jgi:hypothetical protein
VIHLLRIRGCDHEKFAGEISVNEIARKPKQFASTKSSFDFGPCPRSHDCDFASSAQKALNLRRSDVPSTYDQARAPLQFEEDRKHLHGMLDPSLSIAQPSFLGT